LSQLATAASDRAVFAMRRWLQHPPSEARNKGAMSNLWLSANPHELMITVTRRRSGSVVTPHQLRRRFSTFMRRVGIGGCCPSCDEPIAINELLDQPDVTQ